MKKTAKNMSREEYIEACKYFCGDIEGDKYNPFNKTQCSYDGEILQCFPYCPRMRRYDRIHKDD